MNTQDNFVEFRLAPEYRRCGVYVTVGFLLIGIAGVWVNIALNRGWHVALPIWVVCCGIALCGLLPLHWRLRVDLRGLWRRRFVGWDLWPWDDFGSGRMRSGFEDRSVVDPARPWWRRKLNLADLTPVDREQVWQWIDLVWQPEETALPDTIEIQYGVGSRARFDADGIVFGQKNLQRYAWSDVESLEIERLRHTRNDFRRLSLRLPNRRVYLHVTQQHGIESRSWKGATAAAIAEFLLNHVPSDRQLVCASLDAPRTLREVDARLAKARKSERQQRIASRCLLAVMFGATLGFAIDGDWATSGILIAIGLPYGLVCNVANAQRKSIKDLERWQTELERVGLPQDRTAA